MGTDPGEIRQWIGELEGPVAVTHEAGPTGFGLARDLRAHGITCLVVAPSRITRAPGDREKTGARYALLLARLRKLGEIVEVMVPSVESEAARDPVRAGRTAVRPDA